MAHALFSPSVLHRRLACPGSAAAERDLPDQPSRYAREGTSAHALALLCFTTGELADQYLGNEIEGYLVTEEMAAAVQSYINAVREIVDATQGHLVVEQRVDYGAYMPYGEPGEGTLDAGVVSDNALHVHDYKHGRGVRVRAERNPQLLAYALGLHERLGALYDYRRVVLHIHQPRASNQDEWELTVDELEEWGRTVLRPGVAAGLADEAPRLPGEEQCQFCKAAGTCAALAHHNLATIFDDFVDLTLPIAPTELDATALGDLLDKVDMIETWIKAVRARAQGLLEQGEDVPGWKLVEGRRGTRAWADEAQAEAALKRLRLRKDVMYRIELITPTQAERLLKAQPRRWEKLTGLIAQSEGKPTLAPQTDKRPAVAPTVHDFNDATDAAMAAGE